MAEPRPPTGPPRRRWVPLAVAAGVVLLPLAVVVVRVLFDRAIAPAGDVALIELRVRDVGSHTPLLGSYSRFGFNQPGPLLFYVLAVPYRLLGARFAGLEVGAVALAALSLLAILSVAWRRGGPVALGGTAAVLALFVHGLGPRWLADPWEPHVLVPVGAALLVLAFDAATGRTWALPLVAAAASLIAQAWSTMLPFACAMGAWALGGVVLGAARRPEQRPSALRAAAVTAAVVLVLWSAPIAEQLRGDPGNLTAMYRTLGGPGERLGVAGAWRAVAGELSHRATWLGADQPLLGFSRTVDLGAAPLVPVGIVALVAATLAAAVRRRRAAWLGATALVAVAAAVLALSRLIPPVFVWIPQWLRLIGMAAWLATGACAWSLLPLSRRARVERPVVAALAVAAAVLSVATAVDATGAWREADPLRDAVVDLASAGAGWAGADEPVLVRSRAELSLPFGGSDVAAGVLVLALERRGVGTVVDVEDANRFGPARAHPGRARSEIRVVLAGDVEESGPPAGFTVVARVDPLTPAQRRRREAVLRDAGLPASTTNEAFLQAASRDPSLQRFGPRLAGQPDLPPLALLGRKIR